MTERDVEDDGDEAGEGFRDHGGADSLLAVSSMQHLSASDNGCIASCADSFVDGGD